MNQIRGVLEQLSLSAHRSMGMQTLAVVLALVVISGQVGTNSISAQQTRPISDSATRNNGEGVLTYINSTYGFAIKYPRSWKRYEEEGYVVFEKGEEFGYLGILPRVVVISEHAYGKSLKEYTTGTIELLKKNTGGFELTEPAYETTYLAGREAHKILFTSRELGNKMKAMAVWSVSNGEAFAIIYIAPENEYLPNLTTAQMMIESFQVNTDIGRSVVNFLLDLIFRSIGTIIQIVIISVIVGLTKLVKKIKGMRKAD